jgi:arginine/ornithine N-succinyltransferase beta subunit
VALLDAGPVLEAHLDALPALLAARRRTLVPGAARGAWWVLLDESADEWRLVRGALAGDALQLAAEAGIDAAWAVPLA